MLDILLSPPIALFLYVGFAALIYLIGRGLAGPGNPSLAKSSLYGSGEEASSILAAPGYRPFFLIAIFFAILHLGVLVLGTGSPSLLHIVYVGGLTLALFAMILG
jgi:NADH:ubiquinone oxidoreductase subunit 3 (subunit A)